MVQQLERILLWQKTQVWVPVLQQPITLVSGRYSSVTCIHESLTIHRSVYIIKKNTFKIKTHTVYSKLNFMSFFLNCGAGP